MTEPSKLVEKAIWRPNAIWNSVKNELFPSLCSCSFLVLMALNLLSHFMVDLCRILGIIKLNTTTYHPQCDGAVKSSNQTLKTMLRKHAAKFGSQWDRFLRWVLWAYSNTPTPLQEKHPPFHSLVWTAGLQQKRQTYPQLKLTPQLLQTTVRS